ncbi:MAG: PadR family transcriptional regulator [Dehalococcoidia bacterium]
MKKRRKVANPLALAVLAQLLMGPTHPYEMGRWLGETGKDRDIKYNRGSLYMVVEQLAKAGFIAAQETVRDTERPERTVYALTDQGGHELSDWMRELVATPQHEYPQFGVALSLLTVLSPAESAELLAQRLAALVDEMDATRASVRTAVEGGLASVFLVEEEYRLAVLDTECCFVTGLIESLKQPDFVRAWKESFARKT